MKLIYKSSVSADSKITTRPGCCLRWTGHCCSDGGLSSPPLPTTSHRSGEDRMQADISPGPGASPARWSDGARKPKPNWHHCLVDTSTPAIVITHHSSASRWSRQGVSLTYLTGRLRSSNFILTVLV